MVNQKTNTGATDDIGKLPESERSEYFVLDLDELWYLELHKLICWFAIRVGGVARRNLRFFLYYRLSNGSFFRRSCGRL